MRTFLRFAAMSVSFFFLAVSLQGASWQILLPERPSLTESTAAEELQLHIQKMTGSEVPIVSEPQELPADHILSVGDTLFARSRVEKEHPDPFKFDEIFIRAEGSNLFLTGHERRGALYAVYTFLEDVCGCRWYTEDAAVIPQREDLVFPPDLAVSYVPQMISREMYHKLASPCLFSARNKGNGNIDEAHGGRLSILNFVHSFYCYIPPKDYFDAHPEHARGTDPKCAYTAASSSRNHNGRYQPKRLLPFLHMSEMPSGRR